MNAIRSPPSAQRASDRDIRWYRQLLDAVGDATGGRPTSGRSCSAGSGVGRVEEVCALGMPSRDHRGGVVLLSLAPLSECLLPRIADGAGRRHPKSIQSTFAVGPEALAERSSTHPVPAPLQGGGHGALASVSWHSHAGGDGGRGGGDGRDTGSRGGDAGDSGATLAAAVSPLWLAAECWAVRALLYIHSTRHCRSWSAVPPTASTMNAMRPAEPNTCLTQRDPPPAGEPRQRLTHRRILSVHYGSPCARSDLATYPPAAGAIIVH